CPWIDQAVLRWLRSPLPILGLAAGVAILCGLFLSRHGFVVFFGLLTVGGLGLVWPWLSVWGLRGKLGFDRLRTREGEPVLARLRVRNLAPWDALGLAVEL